MQVLKYFSSFTAVKIGKKRMIDCTLFLPIFTAAKDEKYFKYNYEFPSSLQKWFYPILYTNIKQTKDKAGLSALIMHTLTCPVCTDIEVSQDI